MKIKLQHDLWNKDYGLELNLPNKWNIEILRMEGDKKKVLVKNRYRKAIASLSPMLKGKKEICILFDDLSRPTKAYKITPYLLELFEKCKIRDEQVRFICALGTHAALDNVAFRKKLGHEILERFPVYNHNPYEHCEYIGKTKLGTPVMVNKEYLSCDFRIGIGAFVPHSFCGFGGGYKIVMPGVSHIDAIEYHHGTLMKKYWESCYGIGKHDGNPLLEDLKEFGRMAGLDATIDVLVNSEADNVDIYAGNPDTLYEYMVPRAHTHYSTAFTKKADIVFANVYGKANEAGIAISLAEQLLKDEGGHIVVLCDIEGGQVVHYLLGRFGRNTWGKIAFGERKKDSKVRKIFIYSQFRDIANEWWFGTKEDTLWSNSLEEIIQILKDEYRGKRPYVSVIPDGTIQTIKQQAVIGRQ